MGRRGTAQRGSQRTRCSAAFERKAEQGQGAGARVLATAQDAVIRRRAERGDTRSTSRPDAAQEGRGQGQLILSRVNWFDLDRGRPGMTASRNDCLACCIFQACRPCGTGKKRTTQLGKRKGGVKPTRAERTRWFRMLKGNADAMRAMPPSFLLVACDVELEEDDCRQARWRGSIPGGGCPQSVPRGKMGVVPVQGNETTGLHNWQAAAADSKQQ